VRHVYLSPHLDDAVLSCGASIHRQVNAGDRVVVAGVFSGDAPAGIPLSPFALVQHGYWGDPPRPMALRRAEDLAALTCLGAEARHLDCQDAVYRTGPDGQWLYASEEALWADVDPRDPCSPANSTVLVDSLSGLFAADAETVVYAPLGVGNHVDHQIVRAAARLLQERGHRLAYYEEAPYAERPGSVAAALAAAGIPTSTVEARSVTAKDVAAKVTATAYYRTQMSILFGGAEAMPGRVWAFAAAQVSSGCLAERIWWPRDRDA
jgi:LmbE family N-acetylglucosaminyl deacetylase